MSLDRRVQILLDPDQFRQVEREATRSGQSVAAVIREAIEVRLSAGEGARAAAAARLIRDADPDDQPGEDWSTAKAALEEDLSGMAR